MFETTEIEIKVVKMPSIENVKIISEINRKRVADEKRKEEEEKRQHYEAEIERGLADLPNLIEFINKKIEESCLKGRKSVCFSVDDTYLNRKHDKRCEYIVPGKASYQLFKHINEIYSSLGFTSECKDICCWGPTAYREGEIYIYWD